MTGIVTHFMIRIKVFKDGQSMNINQKKNPIIKATLAMILAGMGKVQIQVNAS